MARYLEAIRKAEAHFRGISICNIPRTDNGQEDAPKKATAMGKDLLLGIFLETLHQPAAKTLEETAATILPIETTDWRTPLLCFLSRTEEPDDPVMLSRIQHRASDYCFIESALYKTSVCALLLRCIAR